MNFKIVTLGCKVNSYESQAMRESLLKAGFTEGENPDLVIVNTCAVTSVAEHKSRQKVSSFKKKYPGAIVVACGCSSQMHGNSFSSIGADIVIGNNNHRDLFDLISRFRKERSPIVEIDTSVRRRAYQPLRITTFDEKVRAFVKIGDGCDNFCSYCIIPLNRGNLRSREPSEILCEIRTLVLNSYREIVITGIDSASYGKEFPDYRFDDLLEDILRIDGLKRLRISSIEASQMTERFLKMMKESPVIQPHLHIPLQSGSDTVLKRMKRKYTSAEFYEKIRRIRQVLPDAALACDVIVGFPGETEEEFEETFRFIERCNFAFLHVFPYSMREGTPAAAMTDQVPSGVKHERVRRLIELGKRLGESYADSFIGKELEVLVESYDPKKNCCRGFSGNYLECEIAGGKEQMNRIVRIRYQGRGTVHVPLEKNG